MLEKVAEWENIRMTEMHGVLGGSLRINRRGSGTKEGAVLRAIQWLGPGVSPEVVGRVVSSLTPEQKERLHLACGSVPTWLAKRLTGALFSESAPPATVGDG